MPWTDPLADPDELRRCMRDVVAISILPKAWRNYDLRRICDSIAGALFTMLRADFVLIILQDHNTRLTEELLRCDPDLNPASVDHVRTVLKRERAAFGDDRGFIVANESSRRNLQVATAPIGLSEYAVLAAGSFRATFPTKTERLLLTIGANQAAIAFQHWLGDAGERRFTILAQRSTDFIGIASLSGHIQYINPAGLQSVGLATPDDALRLRVLDFVSRENRQLVRKTIWPLVLRTGQWKGELDLVHFGSGLPIPFLVDCFRIDDPRTGQPMNVATVSRDLSLENHAEAESRHLNESLERRVEQRTIELAAAHKKLTAQKLKREQSDLRLRKLRDEMFRMARFTAAGQMAALITHELSQPLTAIVNSMNATKRLLNRTDRASLAIAQDVASEAAAEALRASEILRRHRQFVGTDEKERRTETLSLMIEEAGELALSSAAPPGANLKFELDARATHAFINRVQIQQVLVNLIRNALEAMADQEQREVTLATRVVGDGMIEVTVADVGPGISEDIARRLFEPFVSSKHNGMGLGLSISRLIIETHGGQLTAESKAGGTSFHFTIPCDGVGDVN
ncbi:GHKL domain-containing protein [Bradyrhizobium rifense]|uniref:histidine kinase n=1 Tax=Bradyrhizobium rifense TaxID=515499 RepID=A0A5D3KHD8_9BRAD|nr:ATP-binding protein [Bradyrhizobium rifense]TYL96368.1 GHKL domain-containing protein [Bradyrhizobium rifense]